VNPDALSARINKLPRWARDFIHQVETFVAVGLGPSLQPCAAGCAGRAARGELLGFGFREYRIKRRSRPKRARLKTLSATTETTEPQKAAKIDIDGHNRPAAARDTRVVYQVPLKVAAISVTMRLTD